MDRSSIQKINRVTIVFTHWTTGTQQIESEHFILKQNTHSFRFLLFMIAHRERQSERGAETLAEWEADSFHWEADVAFDPGSPGSHPEPKAGAKLLHHPGIPTCSFQLHMGHSTEQISWPTNQPSTGTTGTKRLISHPVQFWTTTLWNLKSTVRKKNWTDQKYVEIMNILLENEWSNQEIK